MPSRSVEFQIKHDRIKAYLAANDLDAVVLTGRANFSWLTCGALNHVSWATELGAASLVASAQEITCLTSNIEAGRIANEQLDDLGIKLMQANWFQPDQASRIFRQLLADKRAAADICTPALPATVAPLAADFAQLRWSLTDQEIARYKQLGTLACQAIEQTCKQLERGMTEMQIAALAARNVLERSSRPWVVLVGADQRAKQYRHPVPTDNKLQRIVMVVLCVEKYGLICSLTRLVSFEPISPDLRRRHQAATAIDAAMNLACLPGATTGDVFRLAQQLYQQYGFADQWQLHHQGGPTGYSPRDLLVTPESNHRIQNNQAFAWNPSIAGTKSEDTIIVTGGDPLILTAAGNNWPMVKSTYQDKLLPRPDILVR